MQWNQWNPFAGCLWKCVWCAPKRTQCEKCNKMEPHYHQNRLLNLPKTSYIHVCTRGDISHASTDFVRKILEVIEFHRSKTFEIASRDPSCFVYWEECGLDIPKNVILATYVETNLDTIFYSDVYSGMDGVVPYKTLSNAPHPLTRLKDLSRVDHTRKAVKMYPLCHFTTDVVKLIKKVNPEWVEVGYGPRTLHLPEPPLHRTISLIMALSQFTKVKVLSLREAWFSPYFKPMLPKKLCGLLSLSVACKTPCESEGIRKGWAGKP